MKNKGSRTERELLHMFHKSGWSVLRSAGSGVISIPNPDLIAGKKGRILAIECKSSKRNIKRYIKEKQIKELKEFSKRLGAEPWVGVRFNNEEWFFLSLNKLTKSKGNNFVLDLKNVKEKGITFNELISKSKRKKRR